MAKRKYRLVKSTTFKRIFYDFGNIFINAKAKSSDDVWYPASFPTGDLEHHSYINTIPTKVKRLYKKFKGII